jgi:tight adherence protein C
MNSVSNFFVSLNAMITGTLGELGPLIVTGILGLLVAALVLPKMMFGKKDPLAKLRDAGSVRTVTQAGSSLRRGGKDDRLDRFAQFLEPQNQDEYSTAQMTMIRAGYRSKGAVQTFHFAQFALGLSGLALGIVYVLLSGGGGSAQASILSVLIPGCVGYYAPKYWVQKRVGKRTEEITIGFPDALDLMLVCIEAGQSLDQAINRVAKEIRSSYPALAEEFQIVAFEMKAGKDKTQVLRDMGERVDIQDVNSFVTVLIQSASFGTSIAEALRVYADEMRDKRVLRAEEKANKLPTKLTLGTMLFCLPPLLIILIGPSVYGISQNLAGGF